jgi:transposase
MATKDMSTITGKTKRRIYTPEYKAEVVRLCEQESQSPYKVAKSLGLTASAVRNWVTQAAVDQGKAGVGPLTTAEREELRVLRKEIRVLRQERDILKRATSFFVKECDS